MAFKADNASNIGKKNTGKEKSRVTNNKNISKRNVTGILNTKTTSSVRSFRVDEYN